MIHSKYWKQWTFTWTASETQRPSILKKLIKMKKKSRLPVLCKSSNKNHYSNICRSVSVFFPLPVKKTWTLVRSHECIQLHVTLGRYIIVSLFVCVYMLLCVSVNVSLPGNANESCTLMAKSVTFKWWTHVLLIINVHWHSLNKIHIKRIQPCWTY